MSKIHPRTVPSSPSSNSSLTTTGTSCDCKPECFTIWMKSLIFNTPGCTVYNSKGEIVYRVDNYAKSGQEVYLMDIQGKVLFSLLQKKLRLFGCWDGYKWDDCSSEKPQLLFRARKYRDICVNLCDNNDISASERCSRYKIVRTMDEKSGGFKIVEEDEVIAEVKQKQTERGILFGNDVLTLTVQPHKDETLIMAIVMVYGLLSNQI